MNREELIEYCKDASNEIIRQDEEIRKLEKKNKQLKDNWNELKKFIGECLEAINIIQKSIGNAIENYTPRILTYKQILDKMQEIEGSDSDE